MDDKIMSGRFNDEHICNYTSVYLHANICTWCHPELNNQSGIPVANVEVFYMASDKWQKD